MSALPMAMSELNPALSDCKYEQDKIGSGALAQVSVYGSKKIYHLG
jgi:hypothetical protein